MAGLLDNADILLNDGMQGVGVSLPGMKDGNRRGMSPAVPMVITRARRSGDMRNGL